MNIISGANGEEEQEEHEGEGEGSNEGTKSEDGNDDSDEDEDDDEEDGVEVRDRGARALAEAPRERHGPVRDVVLRDGRRREVSFAADKQIV